MTKQLNVLLIESQPGVGAASAQALAANGHQVHRCHEVGSSGFPCAGVAESHSCPIEENVDVALLVRDRQATIPSRFEGGVSRAIRAGVPIVESGTSIEDPYVHWVVGRAAADPSEACLDAAAAASEPLVEDMLERMECLLQTAGIDRDDVSLQLEPAGSHLQVHVELPQRADRSLRQALAVRVLDSLRADRHSYRDTDVSVDGPEPEAP